MQWNKNAPLLSDILFCKEEYRVAIENFLEPVMNYYVVQNYQDAIEAIQLLSNSSRGKANFFVLNQIKTTKRLKTIPNMAIAALDIVEVEEKYKSLAEHLLQNVYLTDDDSDKNLNDENLAEGLVLIGKSGKFYKTAYVIAGGSVGLFEGKRIGRAKNLGNLAKEIKSLNLEINRLKEITEENSIKLSSLKASSKTVEIQILQKEFGLLQNQLVSVKTKQ